MKYGIWCKYNDTNWVDGWATAGLVKDIVKIGCEWYNDEDGYFYTTDINLAYRYMEYLINYKHHQIKWNFEVEVKEK